MPKRGKFLIKKSAPAQGDSLVRDHLQKKDGSTASSSSAAQPRDITGGVAQGAPVATAKKTGALAGLKDFGKSAF